jgi:hypothetical protein
VQLGGELVKWLNSNGPSLQFFAAIALLLATGLYVWLTGRIVRESRNSREPFVTIDFEITGRSTFCLVVENRGLRPATNVRIDVEQDVESIILFQDRKGLANLEVAKNGISYLAPARKLKYYLVLPAFVQKRDATSSLVLVARISYQNERGKRHENTVTYDFEQLREVLFDSFEDSHRDIVEAVREVAKKLDRLPQRPMILGQRILKNCSMCYELIPSRAKKCAHCGELQPETETVKPPSESETLEVEGEPADDRPN